MPGGYLQLDDESLAPIIQRTVEETLRRVEQEQNMIPKQEVFTEAEAAMWLQLKPHVLRDERLRGRITASKIVGRRIRYLRSDLLSYLTERRYTP